jgi:hypothetical protein
MLSYGERRHKPAAQPVISKPGVARNQKAEESPPS